MTMTLRMETRRMTTLPGWHILYVEFPLSVCCIHHGWVWTNAFAPDIIVICSHDGNDRESSQCREGAKKRGGQHHLPASSMVCKHFQSPKECFTIVGHTVT